MIENKVLSQLGRRNAKKAACFILIFMTILVFGGCGPKLKAPSDEACLEGYRTYYYGQKNTRGAENISWNNIVVSNPRTDLENRKYDAFITLTGYDGYVNYVSRGEASYTYYDEGNWVLVNFLEESESAEMVNGRDVEDINALIAEKNQEFWPGCFKMEYVDNTVDPKHLMEGITVRIEAQNGFIKSQGKVKLLFTYSDGLWIYQKSIRENLEEEYDILGFWELPDENWSPGDEDTQKPYVEVVGISGDCRQIRVNYIGNNSSIPKTETLWELMQSQSADYPESSVYKRQYQYIDTNKCWHSISFNYAPVDKSVYMISDGGSIMYRHPQNGSSDSGVAGEGDAGKQDTGETEQALPSPESIAPSAGAVVLSMVPEETLDEEKKQIFEEAMAYRMDALRVRNYEISISDQAIVVKIQRDLFNNGIAIKLLQSAEITVEDEEGTVYIDSGDITEAEAQALQSDVNESTTDIQITLTEEGREKLAELTRNNIGHCVAVKMDGMIVNNLQINEEIMDGKFFLGGVASEDAPYIALCISKGRFPCGLDILETTILPPA